MKIEEKVFNNRLFVGTGKYASLEIMHDALQKSQTELVTVAIRRVDIDSKINANILDFIPKGISLLPNTSGARNAKEAIRIAYLSRELLKTNWIKLEVTPDPKYLLPDPIETLIASEVLAKEGFVVMPYINADPILCKKLEDVGCKVVMPLASPIGSNRGIKTLEMLKIIIEMSSVPVVVDAGLGSPSDAMKCMELGASFVLVNTAIATSKNPVMMAEAFYEATKTGLKSFNAGLGSKQTQAEASSPLTGFLR